MSTRPSLENAPCSTYPIVAQVRDEEAIEEWLDDVKTHARGERLPLHEPAKAGTHLEPMPAGLLIDADANAVDLFRPWVRPSEAWPGPPSPSLALDSFTFPDGTPMYTHVLRATAPNLVAWGETLDAILGSEHVGPNGLACWEHALLVEGRPAALEEPDRLNSFIEARTREREKQGEALRVAARSGDRTRVRALLKLGVAPREEVVELALQHGHEVIAADALEDADLDTLTAAVSAGLAHGRSELVRKLLSRGGARLLKRVAPIATDATRFVALVEHLVALKKKPPPLPRARWWSLEEAERLARIWPEGQLAVQQVQDRLTEEAKERALQQRLMAAIRADDAALVRAAIADGADASTKKDGERPYVAAVESASADVVRALGPADHWSAAEALMAALARGAPILPALLESPRAMEVLINKIVSASEPDALALYERARAGGFVPPAMLLLSFKSRGPMAPLTYRILEDVPALRSLVERELVLDALVRAIGTEASWSLLGSTPSLWWNGILAAWIDGVNVYVKADEAAARALEAGGAGEEWPQRADFRRAPATTEEPTALRQWLELAR